MLKEQHGTKGAQGATGQKGETGTQGTDGNFGGNSFDYTFNSSTSDGNPGGGKISLQNAGAGGQVTATSASLSETNDEGNSIQSTLQTIESVSSAVKGHMRISNRTDSTQFITYAITDLEDQGAWWRVAITGEASGAGGTNPFSNDEDILISFVTTGDKGDKGQKGEVLQVPKEQMVKKVLKVLQERCKKVK